MGDRRSVVNGVMHLSDGERVVRVDVASDLAAVAEQVAIMAAMTALQQERLDSIAEFLESLAGLLEGGGL